MTVLIAIHPGEILKEEYLVPLNMSALALAKKIGVPRTRIERIITRQTSISADTALRLSRFFNTTAQFWLNLQADYDLKQIPDEVKREIDKIEQLVAA